MPVKPERSKLALDRAAHATALLVIDMVSDWEFPDGRALLAAAHRMTPRLVALRRRLRAAGVPTVFVNDNQGRWRSDFRSLVEASMAAGGAAAAITALLAPDELDYTVLKPKHSAFHATPLDLLLRHLRVRRVVLTGVTADQCVAYSAAEAKMHDYDVVVARDAVAALSAERVRATMKSLEQSVGVDVRAGSRIRL